MLKYVKHIFVSDHFDTFVAHSFDFIKY